jgi:nicotinamidase-related amidase
MKNAGIVVVDMWNEHWCKTHTRRVGELVPNINAAIAGARERGAAIMFAPADCLGYYVNHEARRAVLNLQKVPPPPTRDVVPAPKFPGPTDLCECRPKAQCTRGRRPWKQQHPGILIDKTDYILDCNNADDLFAVCAKRNTRTLYYMGTAANLCVMHRKVGMLNAIRHGFHVRLVADCTIAITGDGWSDASGQRKAAAWFTPAYGTGEVLRLIEASGIPVVRSADM